MMRRIIDGDKINRRHIAEKQYRLGMFHLRKGDEAGAIKRFTQLAGLCPDQKVIIARANAELYMWRFREQCKSHLSA